MRKHSLSHYKNEGYATQYNVVSKHSVIASEGLTIDSSKTGTRYEVVVTKFANGEYIVSVLNFHITARGRDANSILYKLSEKGMNAIDATELMTIIADNYDIA